MEISRHKTEKQHELLNTMNSGTEDSIEEFPDEDNYDTDMEIDLNQKSKTN